MRLDYFISDLEQMIRETIDRSHAQTFEIALRQVDTRSDLLEFLQTNAWALFAHTSQPVALADKLAYAFNPAELASIGIVLNQSQPQSMDTDKPIIMVNSTDEWISIPHTQSSPTLYCGKYNVTVPVEAQAPISAGNGCFVENHSQQKIEFLAGSHGLDPNRTYYVPALFLQNETDTAPFERLIDNENYEQLLPEAKELISELGGMESMERLYPEAKLSPVSFKGDCLYAEDDKLAIVNNAHEGGTISIHQKMDETTLIEHLQPLSESKPVLQGDSGYWKGSADAKRLLDSLRLKAQLMPSGEQIGQTQSRIHKVSKGY